MVAFLRLSTSSEIMITNGAPDAALPLPLDDAEEADELR